jgi:hypothetical protein
MLGIGGIGVDETAIMASRNNSSTVTVGAAVTAAIVSGVTA